MFLFKVYSYFKGALAAIHLSRTILFQEATCNDLIFSRVLYLFQTSTCKYSFFKYTELIHHSSCSHSFEERPFFYDEKAMATHFLQDI